MPDPWTHHTMKVNGFSMHYVVAGSGYPLVFLHGWPQTWYEWRKIIPSVAEHFTVNRAGSARLGRQRMSAHGL